MFGDDYGVLVREDSFGYFKGNEPASYGDVIRRFTLENENQMTVEIITYGATVTSIKVPDKDGVVADVVLGFDDIAGYYQCPHYFGCTVGRVSNRILNGSFSINNELFQVSKNHGDHHLHGGFRGYDKVLWDSHVEGRSLLLTYVSPDKEEGYPGEIVNKVMYSLTDDNELIINYECKTTKPTPISLTNHSYFNLAGHHSGSVDDHEVCINADSYTPVSDNLIPTGDIQSVNGTIFDFLKPAKLKDRLSQVSGGGFDHNFCLNGTQDSADPLKVACVTDPVSQRMLEVFSTQRGLHLYTANFLPEDDSLKGKNNAVYRKHGAMCLELQNYPNSVNQANFPNCVIQPDDAYHQTTVYKFSVISDNVNDDD